MIFQIRTIVIVIVAAMLAVMAIAQEMPKQSFAQQNATATQAPGQNATRSPQSNQTVFMSEGNTTTLTMNSTVIPLQTTTIEVVTVTKTIDSELMSELRNMTVTAGETAAPSFDLSRIQNQTVTGATGQAISTIVTRTDVPYNVTTLHFTSTTGQNQTFTLNLTTSPEQVIEQLFNIRQQMSGNQTTQNNTSAAP
jgi:hypothetical protein